MHKNSIVNMSRIKKNRLCLKQDPCGTVKTLSFVIELDEDMWQRIKPIEVCYSGRTYEKLNTPWTDIIAEKIWDHHKLPCAFSFKKCQIFKTDGFPYLKFFGSCKECGAPILGVCKEKPSTGTSVKIFVTTQDTTKIRHVKKRRLARCARTKAKEVLKGVKATHYRHRRADELANDSGLAPPFLQTTAVFHRARQEAKDEDLELERFPGDVITSTLLMMDQLSSIREFSTVPLYVWYWTENQLQLWNDAAKLDTFISIDASGSFVQAVNIISGHKSSHIFLYNIVIRLRNKIYTICQMLSGSHDTCSIFLWLFGWIQSGAQVPKEVVVDCSMALLNAACLAFNACTYNNYLDKCYTFLLHQNKILPRCYIKRDRAHLIKAVLRWKCFSKANWVQSDFYARCIAYSLEVEDLALLEEIMTALFIVCQSKTIDTSTECFKRKAWLEKKIATFEYGKYYQDNVEDGKGKTQDTNTYDHINECADINKISEYIHKIHNNCLPLCSADDNDEFSKPNNYYLPKISDSLISLYSQFPAWTNVMRRHYSSKNIVSTSTGSECYYRIMRRDYGMSCPVSLNRFLLMHLRLINGATKLGRGVIKEIECHASGMGSQSSINTQPTEKKTEHLILDQNKEEESKLLDVKKLLKHYMRDIKPDLTVAQYSCKDVHYYLEECHVLWTRELRTLKPSTWVDGSVIDSFMIVNCIQYWQNVTFFPTSQTIYMIGDHCNDMKPRRWPMYNIDFVFSGIVFLPYRFRNHWCLLVLDVQAQTVTHFDPLISSYSGNRTVEAFLTYTGECAPTAKNTLCNINWKIVQSPSQLPIQTDSHSCGVFVMYYMDCLAKGKLSDNSDFDPNIYRNKIAHQLISSSESMNDICLYCLNGKRDVCLSCKICQRWIHNDCLLHAAKSKEKHEILADGICLLCA